MKSLMIIVCALLLGMTTYSQTTKEKVKVNSDQEKINYSIGFSFAQNLKANSVPVDFNSLFEGIKDGIGGDISSVMSDSEMTATLTTFQAKAQKARQEKMQAESGKNKEACAAFLADNGKKEGVVTLASGLQYKVLESGKGKSPVDTSTVTTHYKGTLQDGTVFDDSYSRGEPVSFPVNGVIPGWTEALKLMKEGDKWMLYIPSNLGYGDKGAGNGAIPAGALLIFQVELLKVD